MDENWEVKLAKELPKVELHLHLDGSISPGIFYYIIFIIFYTSLIIDVQDHYQNS